MITDSGESNVTLRRFHSSQERVPCPAMPGQYSYHNAESPILQRCKTWHEPYEDATHKHHTWHYKDSVGRDDYPKADPRWPVQCACGYRFLEEDYWQVATDRIYKGPDGQEYSLHAPPVGALWYAEWLEDIPSWWSGPDGRVLMAKTPGGEWCIDSRASNCTMPDDNEHRCWVRHGVPPEIHVDKNGNTCAAGAGSIVAGNYHGFLHNGYFTDG